MIGRPRVVGDDVDGWKHSAGSAPLSAYDDWDDVLIKGGIVHYIHVWFQQLIGLGLRYIDASGQ